MQKYRYRNTTLIVYELSGLDYSSSHMDSEFLQQMKYGVFSYCGGCPRKPQAGQEPWFGTSCREHHSDGTNVDIAWMMADPGSEVRETKTLCVVHNLRDSTSRNALRFLRKLGIGSTIPEAEVRRIFRSSNPGDQWFNQLTQPEQDKLRRIYPTNAVLHGSRANNLSAAGRSCCPVIRRLISELSPKVLIAFGGQAAKTIFLIEREVGHEKSNPALVHSLWDGEPRQLLGTDVFFLFHHSQLGLANARKLTHSLGEKFSLFMIAYSKSLFEQIAMSPNLASTDDSITITI